tara:strand:+ start:852 stop:3785 length:2934 start_codon:yes stop_codon:yes gene_type:complete
MADPSENHAAIQQAGISPGKDNFYQSLFQNAQLALINVIDRVATFNKRFNVKDNLIKKDARVIKTSADKAALGVLPKKRTGYRTFVPIQSVTPQEPDLLVTQIAGRQHAVNDFMTFKLSSAQQALLVPRIRIFKLEYDEDPSNPGKPGKIAKQIEVEFDGVTHSDDILTILENRRGKLSGTGIESFEWALKGVNPGEVDNNIEATLGIYFNNVSDLFKDKFRNPNLAAGAKGRASFLDLVVFAPSLTGLAGDDFTTCPEKLYNGKFFEIRIDVGWATPPRTDKGLFTELQRDYIKAQRTTLFLQLTDHAFEFEEDGSATLTANYRARYSLTDEKYDILRLDDDSDIKSHMLNLKNLDRAEDPTEAQKETKTSEKDALEILLKEKYREIIRELITKHVYYTILPPTLLLINSDNNDLLDLKSGGAADGDVNNIQDLNDHLFSSTSPGYNKQFFDDVIKPLKDAYDKAANNIMCTGPMSLEGASARNAATRAKYRFGLGSYIDETLSDDADDSIIRAGGQRSWPLNPDGRNTIRLGAGIEIPFFFLGDIIEVFFTQKGLLEDIRKKEMGFILTDMEFVNPRKIYALIAKVIPADSGLISPFTPGRKAGIELQKIKCGFSGLTRNERSLYMSSTNIANIPISVDLFMDFIKRKIVGEQKINYYLEDFINDIVNEFVKPIFRQNSIAGSPAAAPIGSVITVETSNRIPFFNEDEALGYQDGPPEIHGGDHNVQADMFPLTVPSRQKRRAAHNFNNPLFDKTYTVRGDIDHFLHDNNVIARITADGVISPKEKTDMITSRNRTFLAPIGEVTIAHGGDDDADAEKLSDAASIKIISFQSHFAAYSGDYADNTLKGIPNFVVGLDRGIIKEVSFMRVDQPYLREARTAKSRSSGVTQLRELYNVNLTLYGNTLLTPGQLIYVEPNQMIFGRPTTEGSIARLLGMGGYHLVVDVANKISAQGWETTVKALHVAMPALPQNSSGT